jgi:16S rRNA (uracil1498-N3)-methyltransferase
MPTPRFFVPVALEPGQTLLLPEATAHHAARVLRLQVGDAITLFNSKGGEHAAVITTIGKRDVEVSIGVHTAVERESLLAVTLVQAVSSGDRMDLTIQKAVELGVTRIVPVQSERCVSRLKGERARKRVAHWQQIVVSACEQCGRNRVPEVNALITLESWLAAEPGKVARWLLSPEAEQPLRELPRPELPIEILVGPEGGFTDTETVMARRAGYLPLRLGPRVLRTETAAPAMIAVMQVLWGDY